QNVFSLQHEVGCYVNVPSCQVTSNRSTQVHPHRTLTVYHLFYQTSLRMLWHWTGSWYRVGGATGSAPVGMSIAKMPSWHRPVRSSIEKFPQSKSPECWEENHPNGSARLTGNTNVEST
ncbi:MAG TPA: hypothetical protein VGO47_05805, partial [Chlamydiales bacterium]|nr:hypothetical protein [Chlamydiales bacterium]